jgi:uncharacterized damage-inducible protein DinB
MRAAVSGGVRVNRPNLFPTRESDVDQAVIDAYEAGGAKLRAAVAGLTRDDLTARPGPGEWSILEVVVHLADSDGICIDRMKRILTEDNPTLLYAHESDYVRKLFTHDQDLDDALTLFEVGRRQFARVLRRLPPEAFARAGTHNRRGELTLGGTIPYYIEHLDYHIGFIRAKRERLGKPLPLEA